MGADFAISGLSMLSGILTARYLLPEGKGKLTAAMLWPALFLAIIGLGMGQAVVYHTGKYDKDFDEVVSSAALVGFVQGSIACVIGFFTIPYILGDYGQETVFSAQMLFLWAPLGRLRDYSMRALQGKGLYRPWNTLRLVEKSLYVVGLIGLWLTDHLTVSSVVVVFILSEVVTFTASIYLLSRIVEAIRMSAQFAISMIRFGVQNLMTSLVGKANHEADQAIISAYLPAESLGLYRVAVSASNMVTILSGGFKHILISEVSRADEGSGKAMIASSLKIAAPMMVVAAAGAVVTAPYLIPLVFGGEYADAVLATQVMSIAAAALGLKHIIYNGLRGFNRPDLPFYCEFVSLAATIALLYLLLPLLGILGAAIASLVAYLTSFILAAITYSRFSPAQ